MPLPLQRFSWAQMPAFPNHVARLNYFEYLFQELRSIPWLLGGGRISEWRRSHAVAGYLRRMLFAKTKSLRCFTLLGSAMGHMRLAIGKSKMFQNGSVYCESRFCCFAFKFGFPHSREKEKRRNKTIAVSFWTFYDSNAEVLWFSVQILSLSGSPTSHDLTAGFEAWRSDGGKDGDNE